MDQRVSDQLEKVLAMADSSHDGEAVVAVRKARQMLSRDGLRFSDLARAASDRPRRSSAFSLFSGQQIHLETQLVQMRQKLDDMQAELHAQQVQAEFWRRRASELEHSLQSSSSEAVRWRQLARETVEKLWDISQSIQRDEFSSNLPAQDLSESGNSSNSK